MLTGMRLNMDVEAYIYGTTQPRVTPTLLYEKEMSTPCIEYEHMLVRSKRARERERDAPGYGEESVIFILALTTEPVLTWAARQVRIMIIHIMFNTPCDVKGRII